MKTLLEMKNFLKELIKGTSFEPFAISVAELIKPVDRQDIALNKQDNVWTNQIMQRVLTKNSNCIDVGCNTGDFLKSIVHLAPMGHHYAFEPIPRLANRLRRRFPNIDTRQIALSDSDGETTFWYVPSSPALSSLNKQSCESHSQDALTEPIQVKIQRLDDILAPELKIHFIKIDVEGAELQVLKGASRTIKKYKPFIVFEHGASNSEESHDDKWHDGRVYDLLVNESDLKIYELKSWLEDLAPLSRDQFLTSSTWNFLAAP